MNRSRRRFPPSPLRCEFLGPAFNACAATNLETDTALLRYRQRRSPMLPIGNILAPMEEDVLVMDGVLVDCDRSDSSEGLRSTVGSSMRRNKSAEDILCRSWEDTGLCRLGSKCQFAHGKEQVRGHRTWKQKPEEALGWQSGKPSPRSAGSHTSSGSKLDRYTSLPSLNTPTISPPDSTSSSPFGFANYTSTGSDTPVTSSGSSLESSSFNWPPTEEEEKLITRALYGPSSRHRLPVFEKICPR